MTIRNFVTGGFLTIDEMCETWGENLEGSNWTEKLWLIRGWCDAKSNKVVGISLNAEVASGYLYKLREQFLVELVQGLSAYLVDPLAPIFHFASPCSDQDRQWLKQARETWGDYLDLGSEDHLYMIVAACEAVIDNQSINQQEALKECFESGLEELNDTTLAELIMGLGTLAANQYIEEAMLWTA